MQCHLGINLFFFSPKSERTTYLINVQRAMHFSQATHFHVVVFQTLRTMITRKWLSAFLVLLSCSLITIGASKSHPVTTFLNAKWFRSPVCLEIVEYLFDENPNLFWDYVEQLHQLEMPLHQMGMGNLLGIVIHTNN